MQGLMWRAYNDLGFLQYRFVETVEAMHPYYVIRALGGILFLIGALLMIYNLYRTIRGNYADDQVAAYQASQPIDGPAGAGAPATA